MAFSQTGDSTTQANPTATQKPNPCPVKDLKELQSTLLSKSQLLDGSIQTLLTSLKDKKIDISTIKTQDQISFIDELYACVPENQDAAGNLGTSEQRKAIRNTILEIKKILDPAKDSFITEFPDLSIASDKVKVAIKLVDEKGDPKQGDVPFGDEAINLLDKRLTELSQKLSSQINSLLTQTPPPSPNPTPKASLLDSTSKLPNPIVTGLGVAAIISLAIIGMLINQQKGIEKLKEICRGLQDKKQDKSDESSQSLSRENTDYRNLEIRVTKLESLLNDVIKQMSEISSHSHGINNDPPSDGSSIASINIPRNPRPLEQQQNGIGVSETRESFEKRWSGLAVPIVLETASNYNFLIINDRELIPKPGSKVTETKLNTIDGLFDYKNFRSGAPFQVIQPAIVSVIPGDRWQVTQKGVLHFE